MKRILSLILTLTMIASLVISLPIAASAEGEGVAVGESNDALLYTNGDDGLTAFDSGQIPDEQPTMAPALSGVSNPDDDADSDEEVIYDSDEDFDYEIIDGKATIVLCNSDKTDLVIPSTFKEYPVVGIAPFIFDGCENLKTVEIAQSIESIPNEMFSWCENLETITVAPENAQYCSVGGVLFNKDKTELLTYPSQKTTKSYEIPDSVEIVSEYAFVNCEYLEEISIPASVKRLCFDFSTCYILKSIEVDSENERYSSEDGILFNKDKTEIISYPAEKKGSSYSIPDSVEYVEASTFMNTRYLESITIPASVSFISSDALAYAGNLEKVVVASGNKRYSSEDGVLFNKDKTELISCPSAKSSTNYKTPSGVEEIGLSAFANCYKLEAITISSGVETIGNHAFAYCDSLEKITLPSTLKEIGRRAFEGCLNLEEITIPDGIEEIEEFTFSLCESLESITISKTVSTIDFGAFEGCNALKTVYYAGTEKEWEDIIIDEENGALLSAKIVFEHKENTDEEPVVKPITSLKFAKTSMTLYAGNEFDLSETLTVKPLDSTEEIIWTSSDEDIATVDENGVVTLIAAGKVTITAMAQEKGKKATCKITVMREPEYIDISGPEAVAKGKSATFKAYAYYIQNDKEVKTKDTISWRSEDESIATVSSKGSVKGIGAGTTKIVAYIDGTDIEAEIEITVAVPVKSMKFASSKATLYVGNNFDLGSKLTVQPLDHNDEIIWESSDEYVATVDENGVVTPRRTGDTTITAKAVAGNKKVTCKVTVSREPQGMEITGANAVAKSKTTTLKAYAYYVEDGKVVKTKDTISWRSEDESIATVSSKGSVKGIGAGTTKIVAYVDGTALQKKFEITVAVPVKSLKFASSSTTLYVGNAFDLKENMTIQPLENTDEIIWSSSNERIAKVSENGVVTPIATGTATITAKAVAGNKKATCKITVSREPEGMEITGDNAVAKGNSVTLKAYAYYVENGKLIKTKDVIKWRSENTSIATVSSKGSVKGITAGTTTIIAYIDGTDLEKKFEVTVAVPVKSLKIDIRKLELDTSKTFDLNQYLITSPEENTDTIVWTSSNERVATVDDGVVRTKAKGEAKITAKATAGKKTATVTITVK